MQQGQENFCVIGLGDTEDTLALLRKLFPGQESQFHPNKFMAGFFRPKEAITPFVFELTPGRLPRPWIAQDRTIFVVASPAKREEIVNELLDSGVLSNQNIVIYRQSHEEKLPSELTDNLPLHKYVDAGVLEGMIRQKSSTQPLQTSVLRSSAQDPQVQEIELGRLSGSGHTTGLSAARTVQSQRHKQIARGKCCYRMGFFAAGAVGVGGLAVGGAAFMGLIALPPAAIIGLVAVSVTMALMLLMLSVLNCRKVRTRQLVDSSIRL